MPAAAEIFEQIIRHQSVAELIPFLLKLTKKDMVAVREQTRKLQKELAEHRQLGAVTWGQVGTNAQLEMLFLAGLSTYSQKEALTPLFSNQLWRLNGALFYNAESGLLPPGDLVDFVCQLLAHRRPDWLDSWLGNTLQSNTSASLDFAVLLQLEARGFIALSPRLLAASGASELVKLGTEASVFRQLHGYTLSDTGLTDSQAQHFGQFKKTFFWLREGEELPSSEALVYERLVRSKDLLERAIPSFFEFDTQLDWAIAHVLEHRTNRRITWHDMFARLVAAGHLDRTDILTRCLLALRRDFRRPLLTWFKELFLALKPTVSERLARQADLVELLAHPQPLVVNFAIEQLKNVWLEPGFDLAPLLLYTDNLLTRLDLKTLLGGLGKLAGAHATHAPAVARLLAAALSHPDTAVQEPAAKSLAALLNPKKPAITTVEVVEITAAIAAQAGVLGAGARATLASWLAAETVASASASAPVAYAPRAQFIPDISPATAVVPVADWHELLFLTGQVLKHDDPAGLERWLDGLLCLHSQLPANHPEQLRPYVLQLLPQLKKVIDAEATTLLHGPLPIWGHDGLAEALLLSWVTGFRTPKVETVVMQSSHLLRMPLLELEQRRYAHAEKLLASQLALPLLSTPTHAPYWVAPRALVTKLLAYEAAGQKPAAADLALALARTAHSHPAEAEAALCLLPQLAHSGLRELLAWFFGPSDVPLPAPTHVAPPTRRAADATATLAEALPELWAVAARTKAPQQGFPTLLAWLGYDYPGAAQPLRLVREVVEQENTYDPRYLTPGQPTTHRWTEVYWHSGTTQPALSALLLYSPPAGNGKQGSWEENQVLASDFPYLAAALPNYTAPLHEYILRCATWADNLESSERDLVAQALRSTLGSGPAQSVAATTVLASGLLHHTPLCRSLGQEVLLRAVANGQLLPDVLGQVLGQQLAVGYAPVPRLAARLATLGGIDALTDDALHQVLDALLPELPAAPLRSLRALLDLYADLRTRTGRPTPAAVQARLGEWRTAPSLKKVANALVA